MEIHRTGKVADWQTVPETDRNRWQRLAAATRGYITPGNIVTVASALLSVVGFVWLYQGELGWGAIAIIIGRLGDALDGYVAHHTGTKSPIGETIDAGADKLVVFVALLVLFKLEVIPAWLAVPLAVQQLIVVALGGYARLSHKIMHPSLLGKASAVALWTVLAGYVITFVVDDTSPASDVVPMWVAGVLHVLLAGSILISFAATLGYARHIGKSP